MTRDELLNEIAELKELDKIYIKHPGAPGVMNIQRMVDLGPGIPIEAQCQMTLQMGITWNIEAIGEDAIYLYNFEGLTKSKLKIHLKNLKKCA